MAPLPTINQCTRVAFSWRSGVSGPTAQNVMHFQTASTDTAALKTALDTNVTSPMWVGTASNCTIYQLSITPLDGQSATQIYQVSGSKWAGLGTPGDFSPATATVISLRTAKRGRRYRGRIYIPFQTEQYMASGTNSVAVTANQTAWDNFVAAMSTASFPLVIATYGHSMHRHKNQDGSYTITPVTWPADKTLVTTATVEAVYGTQRRRQSRLR